MAMTATSKGMLRSGTPIEDYRDRYGLWVKREDMSCPPPGPPFSKTRGVYAHLSLIEADTIGVLDTYHSQAGHAVARACQVLGKQCINYYPEFKYEPGPRKPQLAARSLGAELKPLPAGRSAILFHQARKDVTSLGGYMMPNALKIPESVTETARETPTDGTYDWVIIPASSGTIAAGVVRGMGEYPKYLIHMGYSRSRNELESYIHEKSGIPDARLILVDESYSYRDKAREGDTPPWPCNEYYDLKAFRWWMSHRWAYKGGILFWNVG